MTGRRERAGSRGASEPAPREVAIANRHSRLRLDRRAIEQVIAILDTHQGEITGDAATPGPGPGELSLVFLTDAALAELHRVYLDDPTTTDVITFAGDPSALTAGEICVSIDTAARFAVEHGGDFSSELTLYVVHGWLHLAGFDDLLPASKRAMRRAEARAMRVLQRKAAVPKFSLRKRR